jgi:hypothetical protein
MLLVGMTRQDQVEVVGSLLDENRRFQLASPIGEKVVVEMNHLPKVGSKNTLGSLTLSVEELVAQAVVFRLAWNAPTIL